MNQLPPTLTTTLDSAIAELTKIRAGLTEPSESERRDSDPLLIEKLELQSVRLAAENKELSIQNGFLKFRMTDVCEQAIAALHLNDMTAFNILHPFTEKGMRERAQAEVNAQEVNEGYRFSALRTFRFSKSKKLNKNKMSKIIWKYTLENERAQLVKMPWKSEIIDIQMQNGKPTMWVMVDPKSEETEVKISRYETGEEIHEDALEVEYLATVQDGELVCHFFMMWEIY